MKFQIWLAHQGWKDLANCASKMSGNLSQKEWLEIRKN